MMANCLQNSFSLSLHEVGKGDTQNLRRLAVSEETNGSSVWCLQYRNMDFPDSFVADIHGLSSLSGGTNLFFESEFQIASRNRVIAKSAKQLILTERLGEETTIRLYVPIVLQKAGLPPIRVLRTASHPYAPLSLPLAEQGDIDEIAERFASLLAKMTERIAVPLMFRDFPLEEIAAIKLLDALRRHGFETQITARSSRAALFPEQAQGDRGEAFFKRNVTSKRRRQLTAQMRKLGELGTVEFEKATEFWDVLTRFEEFLLIETRGWKGRRGTSIHTLRRTAAFARQSVGQLARLHRAAIYSLRLDGRSIASLIVLKSGNRYYPWKISHDEHYDVHAPGIQLLMHATKDLISSPGFSMADSLAPSDSVVNRLWPDRITLGTLIIANGKSGTSRISRLAAALDRETRIRELAKRWLRR